MIGRGSNLLFGDGTIETVLIRTAGLDAVRTLPGGRMLAQCGVSLATLCRRAAGAGYAGLEFAFGIPGSVGGAAFMNAGAYGKAISDVLESALVYLPETDEIKTYFNHQLGFSYRNSKFQSKNAVLLAATFALREGGDPRKLQEKMNALADRRKRTQPLELPNAGSTFRRPDPTRSLSPLLDELGLKGLSVGGAAVSQKHVGFIVNKGGATAADVKMLISKIQTMAELKTGIRPTPEIRFIPEDL